MRAFFHGSTAAALLWLAAASAPAAAQSGSVPSTGVFKTGEQIYQLCISSDANDRNYCDYFLMGAHDMAKFYDDTKGDLAGAYPRFCAPMGLQATRLREVMVAYWRDNPRARQLSASSSIRQGMTNSFPCR